jgi:hypothetical protein
MCVTEQIKQELKTSPVYDALHIVTVDGAESPAAPPSGREKVLSVQDEPTSTREMINRCFQGGSEGDTPEAIEILPICIASQVVVWVVLSAAASIERCCCAQPCSSVYWSFTLTGARFDERNRRIYFGKNQTSLERKGSSVSESVESGKHPFVFYLV